MNRNVHFFNALRDLRANHPEELNIYSEKKASRFAMPERRKNSRWPAGARRDFSPAAACPQKSCR
jgi:hypothetical protein